MPKIAQNWPYFPLCAQYLQTFCFYGGVPWPNDFQCYKNCQGRVAMATKFGDFTTELYKIHHNFGVMYNFFKILVSNVRLWGSALEVHL